MSIVDEIREIANKANRERRLKAEKARNIAEAAARGEARAVYEQILSFVRRAASEGEYFVDVDALATEINSLSASGLQACLDGLRIEGLEVELSWATDTPLIGSPRPRNHDIEGCEEYDRMVAEATTRYIDKIRISWHT